MLTGDLSPSTTLALALGWLAKPPRQRLEASSRRWEEGIREEREVQGKEVLSGLRLFLWLPGARGSYTLILWEQWEGSQRSPVLEEACFPLRQTWARAHPAGSLRPAASRFPGHQAHKPLRHALQEINQISLCFHLPACFSGLPTSVLVTWGSGGLEMMWCGCCRALPRTLASRLPWQSLPSILQPHLHPCSFYALCSPQTS